jgi:heme-degrading monooxygenase HmoA
LLRDVEQPGRFMSFGDWESLDASRPGRSRKEFAARMRRVREHADLTPSTYELVSES